MGSLLAAYWARKTPADEGAAGGSEASAAAASPLLGFWKLDLLAAGQEDKEDARKRVIAKWVDDWRARTLGGGGAAARKPTAAAGGAGAKDELAARQKEVKEWIARYKARSAAAADQVSRQEAVREWIAAWRARTGVNVKP